MSSHTELDYEKIRGFLAVDTHLCHPQVVTTRGRGTASRKQAERRRVSFREAV